MVGDSPGGLPAPAVPSPGALAVAAALPDNLDLDDAPPAAAETADPLAATSFAPAELPRAADEPDDEADADPAACEGAAEPAACEGAAEPADGGAASELTAASSHLAELGYLFTDAGELRGVQSGAPFKFVNQPHYERLADAVAAYCEALLVQRHDLKRRCVRGTDVLVSPGFESAPALLLLLCGAGLVAAGQWARRLCINESLAEGSVLPYVAWAAANALPVCILNPNARSLARGASSFLLGAEQHTLAVWDDLVAPAAAKHVVMVAHSFGGCCVCELLSMRAGDASLQKLVAIALTDSVHGNQGEHLLPAQQAFFTSRVCNWVTSGTPLDTVVCAAVSSPQAPAARREEASESEEGFALAGSSKRSRMLLRPPRCDAARLSAGVTEHEATSDACRPSACAFLLHHLHAAGWTMPES